jgi:arginase
MSGRDRQKDKFERVEIIGVPLDHGAGRRGVGMGPSALRIARLHERLSRLGYALNDLGDLVIPAPETRPHEEVNARFLSVVAETCETLARDVKSIMDRGGFPLVIGGDHSLAIGSISGIAAHARELVGARQLEKVGVIWFDAHGDSNTPETSPSGNIHGMPLACLLGRGPQRLTNVEFEGAKLLGRNIAMIGLRDLDPQERQFMADVGIHAFSMHDIDRLGMAEVMERAIALASHGTRWLHLSFDIDALDPRDAPGTGTEAIGGITYREAHLALEMLAETQRLTSMELVEINPILDERNRTAEVGVGLIASALGSRIL